MFIFRRNFFAVLAPLLLLAAAVWLSGGSTAPVPEATRAELPAQGETLARLEPRAGDEG